MRAEAPSTSSPMMWFTYGQKNTTIPEQRSVTTGCGGECFPSQISPCFARSVYTTTRMSLFMPQRWGGVWWGLGGPTARHTQPLRYIDINGQGS